MTFAKMPRCGNFCIRLISIFLIPSFIFSNLVYAVPATDAAKPSIQETAVTNPESVVIPREFGLVKTKFTGKDNRLVIHIQDAHCNYEAQSNIVKILEGLYKNYNVSLVSVEGADGIIDTSWFKAFPDDEVRKEVADYFMKKGEITGPEFLSITTDYNVKLFGAETRSYYIENLNAFTSSYPLKAETEKYLNSIRAVLNRLKGFIYSEDLKLMDAKYQDYDSKKIQFNDYVKFLQVEAERAKLNLRAYDNFFKLVSVLVYEKKIDFTVTDKERSALIDAVSKAIPKDALTELVNKSLEFKTGKTSSADYYSYLKKLAIDNGVDLARDYPNLYNYIIYNSVYSRIENEKLFNDIKKLESDIKEKLFTNDDQRTLEKLSRHIEILIGLVNIKLLNGDYEYFEQNKAEFSHEIFSDFMKKKTIQYGLAYEMDDPNDAVAKALPKLEDFYSIAIKRDRALVDNTLSQMKKEKTQIAVLVTGGFHSEGMAKLLEKQGVSYMVVCPSITKDVPTPYIQILTNQRTPLQDILVTPAHASEAAEKADTLGPYLLSAARQLTKKELEELSGAVAVFNAGAPDARTLQDRVQDFYNKGWEPKYIQRWMKKSEKFAGKRGIFTSKDIMYQAFCMSVDAAHAAKALKVSDEDIAAIKELARVAFDDIYEVQKAQVAALEASKSAKAAAQAAGRASPDAAFVVNAKVLDALYYATDKLLVKNHTYTEREYEALRNFGGRRPFEWYFTVASPAEGVSPAMLSAIVNIRIESELWKDKANSQFTGRESPSTEYMKNPTKVIDFLKQNILPLIGKGNAIDDKLGIAVIRLSFEDVLWEREKARLFEDLLQDALMQLEASGSELAVIARQAAGRASPGTAVLSQQAADGTILTAEQIPAFNGILKKFFADRESRVKSGQLRIIPFPAARKGFNFVAHDGMLDALDRAGLPLNIHPSRGGEEYNHELLQAQLDSFFYDNLTSDERLTVANHELAHIDIHNGLEFPNKTDPNTGKAYKENPTFKAYMKARGRAEAAARKTGKALDLKKFEEWFVNTLPGCNTVKVTEKLRTLLEIRRKAKIADKPPAGRNAITRQDMEDIIAMDETLARGQDWVKTLFTNIDANHHDPSLKVFAMDYLKHRAQLDAIEEIRNIPQREGAGAGAYIFVSSNEENAAFWQKRFEDGRGTVLPKDAIIISVSEENWKDKEKGPSNGFGTFNGWLRAEQAYDNHYKERYEDLVMKKFGRKVSLRDICREKGVIMMHMAGKATRMQPLAMADKSAIKLPLPARVFIAGRWNPLTVGEAVIMNFGLNVRPGRLTLAWGDQNNIPSANISSPGTYMAEIFGVYIPIEGREQFLPEKGLLPKVPDTDRGVRQREKLKIAEIIANAEGPAGRKVAHMSLGFNSFRIELLEAALQEFKAELANEGNKTDPNGNPINLMTSLNIDPEFWGPFTSTQSEYIKTARKKAEDEAETKAVTAKGAVFDKAAYVAERTKEAERLWIRVQRIFDNAYKKSDEKFIIRDASGVGVIQGISYGVALSKVDSIHNTSEWWDWGLLDQYYDNLMLIVKTPENYRDRWQRERLIRFFRLPSPEQWKSGSKLGSTVKVQSSLVLNSNIKHGNIVNSIVINSSAEFMDVKDAIVIGSKVYKLVCKGHNIVTDYVSEAGEKMTLEEHEILACHFEPKLGQMKMFESFSLLSKLSKPIDGYATALALKEELLSLTKGNDKQTARVNAVKVTSGMTPAQFVGELGHLANDIGKDYTRTIRIGAHAKNLMSAEEASGRLKFVQSRTRTDMKARSITYRDAGRLKKYIENIVTLKKSIEQALAKGDKARAGALNAKVESAWADARGIITDQEDEGHLNRDWSYMVLKYLIKASGSSVRMLSEVASLCDVIIGTGASKKDAQLKGVVEEKKKEILTPAVEKARKAIRAATTDGNTPSTSARYQLLKDEYGRSAYGETTVFGTSGVREFVKFLQDIKCDGLSKGIMSFMESKGQPSSVALAGDLRPSTERITLINIMSALQWSVDVLYAGNLPTPAIVNYGMYRLEGAVPSSAITASHCPVLPLDKEQNGIKPNITTGEVLKEDERNILKHAREFLEIEFMLRKVDSIYSAETGMRKAEGLNADQEALVRRALNLMEEIAQEMKGVELATRSKENIYKIARQMYVDRYMAFGEIFDENDTIPFMQHMSVGRDVIIDIFRGLYKKGTSDNFKPEIRHEDWQEDYIVDTEAISKKLAAGMKDIAGRYKGKARGIFTTDGDSDRPGLFDEDGEFVYGDKLGYLTCEYIANLKFSKGQKLFVAITATVSNAVKNRILALKEQLKAQDITLEVQQVEELSEVEQVQIGSPYVVKAMQDRIARAEKAGEKVITCGFERNGGFLLGSDIKLDNGNVISALPTRDSMLPVICAFSLAKKNNMTIKQLVGNRFSGDYSCFSWSDLIEVGTKMPESANPDAGVRASYEALCNQYTATMGQAIMMYFSPAVKENIVNVKFNDNGGVTYLKRGKDPVTVGPEDKFAVFMRGKKTELEGYFNEGMGFKGGIAGINYLDGVRLIMKNGEVVHMRPSGNSPQWRLYSEAADEPRAKAISNFIYSVYPKIIEKYLGERKKYEGMRIKPRDNQAMKDTFAGIFDTSLNQWKTWPVLASEKNMTFGARGENALEEYIDFGKESVAFRRVTTYAGKFAELLSATGHPANGKLTVIRTITWNRADGTLTAKEAWSDNREVAITYKAPDAWLEIGRGLGKNIPMGKFQDMPFPVISDKAKAYFKERGILWFDLFDLAVESEFTEQAPMWADNFNFKASSQAAAPEISLADADIYTSTPAAVNPPLSAFSANAAAPEQPIAPTLMLSFSIPALEDLRGIVSRTNLMLPNYMRMDAPQKETVKKYYRDLAALALDDNDAEYSRALQIMAGNALAIMSMIEQNIPGAEELRLTTDAVKMVKARDKDRGLSYIDASSVPSKMGIAANEGGVGLYWRGWEGIQKLGDNISAEAVYDRAKFEAQTGNDKFVMYTMLHVGGYHTTVFLHDTLPGSLQCTSTGPGHVQDNLMLDIKVVTKGTGIQYIKMYNDRGELIGIEPIYLEPGTLFFAIPGTIDSVENLGGLEFNDISIPVTRNIANKMAGLFVKDMDIADVTRYSRMAVTYGQAAKIPYYAVNINGTSYLVQRQVPGKGEISVWKWNMSLPTGEELYRTIYATLDTEMERRLGEQALNRLKERESHIRPEAMTPIKQIPFPAIARAAQAARVAESGTPKIMRPSVGDKTLKGPEEGYAWAGLGISRMLKWPARKIAEFWINSTHKDGLSVIIKNNVELREAIRANPGKMLGSRWQEKPIFSKFLGKDQTQPPILYMGFNGNIVGNEAEFVKLAGEERESVKALRTELEKFIKTEEQFNEYQAAYAKWVGDEEGYTISERPAPWEISGLLPTLPTFMSGFDTNIFMDLQKIRQKVVGYFNVIKLEPGQVIVAPSGYIHSIVGSLQGHPIKGEKSKSEAWYVLPDGIIFEAQTTSNTTYSPFDFPTPIEWKNGRVEMRKDMGKKLDTDIEELGGIRPATDVDAVMLMAEKAFHMKPTGPEDFILADNARAPRDITSTGRFSEAIMAKAESLIEGVNTVMPEGSPFTLERVTLKGEGQYNPASIISNPVKESFHELTVVKGKVEVRAEVDGKMQTVVLTPGSSIFVPASYEKPLAISSEGEAEVLKMYPGVNENTGEYTVEEIIAAENKETGYIKGLVDTLGTLKVLRQGQLRNEFEKGVIINAFDTDIEESRGAMQEAAQLIEQEAGGCVINVRRSGKELSAAITEAITAAQNAGKRVLVTVVTTPDKNLAAQLTQPGRKIVNPQLFVDPSDKSEKPRYLSVPGLSDLALRIAITELIYKTKDGYAEDGLRWLSDCLNRIALQPNNKPFAMKDILDQLTMGLFRILPKIVPANFAAAREAHMAAQAALHSL